MSDEMKPVAWGIAWSHDDLDCEHVYESRGNAKAVADNGKGSIIPLYRSPTLTDAEREAVEVAARFMDKWGGVPNTIASDALRGLLERTK